MCWGAAAVVLSPMAMCFDKINDRICSYNTKNVNFDSALNLTDWACICVATDFLFSYNIVVAWNTAKHYLYNNYI